MKTVCEVSKLSGVSVRTLHYYDSIGLLKPAKVTEAGYRLYDDGSLCRLQSILLYRELGFSLREIHKITATPSFNARDALGEQIKLLKRKRQRLDRIIAVAGELQRTGVEHMDFSIFDNEKEKKYARQAKEKWGETDAYREFEGRKLTREEMKNSGAALMGIFAQFGKMTDRNPEGLEAQELVERLRAFITANYYTCTVSVMSGLGQMYATPGEMKDNIDRAGGEGTADFASAAIAVYCGRQN